MRRPGFPWRWFFVLGLSVLYFLATDRLVDHWMAIRVARPDFRFLPGNLAGLDELSDHLQRKKDPLILFIGDSIVQGNAVKYGRQTIPFGFHQAINESSNGYLRTVNLGLPGSSPKIQYRLAERMLDTAPEFIFLVVNYRGLRRSEAGSVYREWLASPPGCANPADCLHRAIDRQLRRRWSLYRNRQLVFGSFLGAPPWYALRKYFYLSTLEGFAAAFAHFTFNPPLPIWTERSWDQRLQDIIRRTFDIPWLAADDENPQTILQTCLLARQRQIGLAVVMPPINNEMLAAFNALDTDIYEYNTRLLAKLAKSAGARFIEAHDWMPSERFVDSVHMLEEGNLDFGRRLAQWYRRVSANPALP